MVDEPVLQGDYSVSFTAAFISEEACGYVHGAGLGEKMNNIFLQRKSDKT